MKLTSKLKNTNITTMEGIDDTSMDTAKSPLLKDNTSNTSSSGSIAPTKVTVDEALVCSGSFGRFQCTIQILLMYIFATIGYQVLLPYFIGDDPAWKCVYSKSQNISSNDSSNDSSDFCARSHGKYIHPDSADFYERCKLSRDEWTYATDKFYSYITEFDLICKQKALGALVSGAIYVGGVFQIITGVFIDRYGRKITISVCLFACTFLSLACNFVTNVWQLICLRIALGIALFPCYAGCMVLLLEFMPPKSRALSASVYLTSFTLSVLLVDLAAYHERNWRKLNLYTTLPGIPALFLFLFVPRSPRWLLGNQQASEAVRVLQKVNAWNGRPAIALSLRSSAVAAKANYTYFDLVRDRNAFFMTLCLGLIYGTMALVYYEIGLEANFFGGNIYKTFALSAVADLPGYFIALYLCNSFGRKKTALGSLMLSGLTIGLIAVIPSTYAHAYTARVILAMISKSFVNISFTSCYIWVFELFPTVLRSQGGSVCAIIEKIGALSVPLLTRLLNEISPILIYIVVAMTAICVSLFGLALKETNKQPTRETYQDLIQDNA